MPLCTPTRRMQAELRCIINETSHRSLGNIIEPLCNSRLTICRQSGWNHRPSHDLLLLSLVVNDLLLLRWVINDLFLLRWVVIDLLLLRWIVNNLFLFGCVLMLLFGLR